MRTMSGGMCLHFDCTNRNSFGYCKTTVCINDDYRYEECMRILAQRKVDTKIKPQTNADRIRAMTDEELAEFLAEKSTSPSCTGKCHKDYEIYGELRTFCNDCWLDWLKQEAKE